MLVVVAELALAQHVPLPALDPRRDIGQQAHRVVRRQNRHAEEIAEEAEHEKPLQRSAHLERLLRDLVAGNPVQELAYRAPPAAAGARAMVDRVSSDDHGLSSVRERAGGTLTCINGTSCAIVTPMTQIIGALAVAIVAWFAAGTAWNVRAGRRLMRWMQGGLPLLGRRTTVRWLGSSVVEMVLNDPHEPFSKVALVIFLEPRDLPWWPLSRLRGRRDTLILRAILKRPPSGELEAVDPASWSGREALPRIPAGWPAHESEKLQVFGDEKRASGLLAAAKRSRFDVRRLSVRREEPQFQLHVGLPDTARPAGEFFEALLALAELALR